jgi:SET family sugar efflux transporter-like MFS transporter
MTRPAARPLVALALVFVAAGLSTAMFAPYLTLFLQDAVHAGSARVAAFLVAAPVASVVLSALLGRLSDRLPDRRPVLLAAALAGCAACALSAGVRDYGAFLLVTVTLGGVSGALLPQLFAHAREVLAGSERSTMGMSALRSVFSLAWVAGPPLAALLLGAGGFTLTYGTAALMYAAAAAVVVLALPPSRGPGGPEPAVGQAGQDGTDGADAPPGTVRLSLGAFVCASAAGALAVQSLPLLVTRELAAGIERAGLLLGLCAGLEIPLLIGFGLLAARVPLHRLLAVGIVCGLAYMALVACASELWQLVLGQVLNAAAVASLSGLGITYVQDLLPRHRGRASTLFTNTLPAGALLAGPVLGAAQETGYRVPFAVGALLYAAALALMLIARHRPQPVAGPVEPATTAEPVRPAEPARR